MRVLIIGGGIGGLTTALFLHQPGIRCRVYEGTPNGHELAIESDAHLTINPHLLKNIPYDTETDLTPVALQFKTYFFVAVSATGPYQSFADIITAVKASPGRLTTGDAVGAGRADSGRPETQRPADQADRRQGRIEHLQGALHGIRHQ